MTGLLRVQSIYPNWLTPPELKAPSADTSVRKSYRVMYKTPKNEVIYDEGISSLGIASYLGS